MLNLQALVLLSLNGLGLGATRFFHICTPCFVLQCYMLYRLSPVQEKSGTS